MATVRIPQRVQALREEKEYQTPKAPTGDELGAPMAIGAGVAPWGSMYLGDDLEQVSELQWPQSVITYNGMRNDSQLEGLMRGTTLPIRRYNWCIDPNGCDLAKVTLLAQDLNLPIQGEPLKNKGRGKNQFSHDDHLRHALLGLVYGHYPMEQVGDVVDGLWRLRKLAPRPPQTLQQVSVGPKGDLEFIQQNISTAVGIMAPQIPVDRLVWYAWDKEGANWFGRSMFRAVYRNWLLKDRLLRVDALKHERNGLGLPVATGAPGYGSAELRKLQKMAGAARVGETSGVALPNGTGLTFEGVRGTLPDTIASIRFHNEEMARSFLMMFMQLGESLHGSRALGKEFLEFFQLNQDTIANWYADTTTNYVVEDWWDWNVDPNADFTPLLTYERTDDPRFAFTDLAQLVTAGVIQVDDELEEALRESMDLPPIDTKTIRTPPPEKVNPDAVDPTNPPPEGSTSPAPKAGRRHLRSVQAAAPSSPLQLPDRPLRRQPDQYEVDASVNLKEMDEVWQNRLDQLFSDWRAQVVSGQVDDLVSQITRADGLEALAALEAPALGAALLAEAMHDMYGQGVSHALSEAVSQKVKIAKPNADDYTATFDDRAAAVDEVNARQLAQMAGTKAMRITGGTLTPNEVAGDTRTYLDGLQYVMLRDRLGGALTAAYNTGRRAVYAEGPAATYYASEILDNNTCTPCTDVDGTTYNKLEDAEADYVGGYVDCSGGDKCRGTLIAVYAEEGKQEEV